MVTLSLPPTDAGYDLGLREARQDAVQLQCPEADVDLLIGIGSAVDLTMSLVGAIARLQDGGDVT